MKLLRTTKSIPGFLGIDGDLFSEGVEFECDDGLAAQLIGWGWAKPAKKKTKAKKKDQEDPSHDGS